MCLAPLAKGSGGALLDAPCLIGPGALCSADTRALIGGLKAPNSRSIGPSWLNIVSPNRACPPIANPPTAMIDSEAVFAARATAMGLAAELLAELQRRGWKTFGTFAFSCSYVPGHADDASFMEGVIVPVLADKTHASAATLRRLFFESYTLAAADLKSRIERTGEDPPRKLPTAERAARFEKLKRSLAGICLEGELEPAHGLVDTAAQMLDDGVLKYIEWADCPKRSVEVLGQKKDKTWKADSGGIVRETSSDVACKADISTDLRLKYALQRRGLAFDMANLMAFKSHEALVTLLLSEYMRDPPPGYAKVSLAQVQRADREIFRRLAEMTRCGLQLRPDGKRPLDTHLPEVLLETGVRVLLMPLPLGRGRDEDSAATPTQSLRKVLKANAKLKDELRAAGASKGHGKASSRVTLTARTQLSTAKGGGRGTRMPKGLVGMEANTPDGARICFSYNLAGCAEKGDKCDKGEHVCCRPGCFERHPLPECPRS